MPLFGPNIKKMKEKGDIQGLLNELKDKNPEIRIEVVRALTELKHIEGLSEAIKNDNREVRIESTKALGELRNIGALAQAVSKSDKREVRVTAAQALKNIGDKDAMEALMKCLSTTIRLGDSDDQIEAMEVMWGCRPKPVELHQVQGLLDELIKEGKHPHSKWFALLTLVELGDRRDEVLQELIKHSVSYTKACDERLKQRDGQNDFALYIVAGKTNDLIEKTMRALATFKGNITATNTVMKILDGEVLVGSYHFDNRSERFLHPRYYDNALCALGALGDLSTRERLEYMASRGRFREYTTLVLENFGKATYDEIMARIRST
jgi:hypothetical protein